MVIFRAYLFIFFDPPILNLKKKPVNQLIKNSGLMSLYVSGCAIAEFCDHDDDCTQTTCHSAFRVDCDHIDHNHIDVRECTCIPLGKYCIYN